MDSVRSRPAPPALTAPTEDEAAAALAAPEAARVGRLVPLVRRAVRTVRRVATVSAGAAVAVWAALFEGALRAGRVDVGLAAVVAALLLAPAALSWLAAWTLQDLVELPARLRASATDAAGRARAALDRSDEPGGKERGGVIAAVWAARGLVLDSRDGWMKVAALARLARLSSLPFALGLVVAFLANFAVIAAGAVALVLLVL